MQIVSIEPQHFGPFATGTRINLEPDVTVLTGANDAGKSAVLRLLQRFCDRQPAVESDVNRDRQFQFNEGWERDPEVGASVTIRLIVGEDPNRVFSSTRQLAGEEFEVRLRVTPSHVSATHGVRNREAPMTQFPKVTMLPVSEELRNVIPIESANKLEKAFLDVALGAVTVEKLKGFADYNFQSYMTQAEERITQKAKAILPSNLNYQFKFSSLDGDRSKLVVQIYDQHRGLTPIGYRGTGARKLLTLLGVLTSTDFDSGCHLILFDEPEISLHADAQRSLRQILETVAKRPNVQVVYATHSPVMINSFRPGSIRVLQRELGKDERPRIRVEQPSSSENYAFVRTSLGMLPSDSLLYSDVGIIIEGDSEARAIPLLLRRLHEINQPGFEQVQDVLDGIHFINGGGDSFDKLARLAKSQGSKPILFLDGDKNQRLRALGKQEFLENVPILELPPGKELEDEFPLDCYLNSIAETHQLPHDQVTSGAFNQWKADPKRPEYLQRKLLSKQIEDWLVDVFETNLSKPLAIEHAASRVDLATLDSSLVEMLRRLCQEVARLLFST